MGVRKGTSWKQSLTINGASYSGRPVDEYERLKHIASQSGTQVDDDEIFLQAVGGKNKKGTVHGLGTESEVYYPRLAHRAALAAATGLLKKSEDDLQVTREELRATREQQKQQRGMITSLLSRLEASSSSPLPPPVPQVIFEEMEVGLNLDFIFG
ncbi:hypothetical protein Cgig2_021294 [Carnegiea gigantea]|uniref:Uncharacterized protein n=1 Tax=Carnegiea gigantea TaxID=171969 RepID=A0A9Q1K5A8_9CARY|nr:hypothetical protein Cgig2_021294 [Carnegiea gigantea]